MTRQNDPQVFGSGNHIDNYIVYNVYGGIHAHNFNAASIPDLINQNQSSNGRTPENSPISSLAEETIPDEIWNIFQSLSPQQQLVCLAIYLLQQEKEDGKFIFTNDNDWWGTYSPLVNEEGFPKDLGSFYKTLEEIGMGHFRVNCSRDSMAKINGVFLKHYDDWKSTDYYGERAHVYWHKKKIADKLLEILKLLHQQMKI
ncbi:MAG: hypothetical protein IJ845_05155 [Bacteroidaceae bacterium]|nr:hypothetical protein [Bacteroidaceae bacterium]